MNAPNQLSFLPDDYLQRKAVRRSNVLCAVLFVAVMSAIGGTFTFSERAIKEAEARHAAIEKEYAEAALRIQQVQQMQDKQRQMAQSAELTASLLERVPRTFVLAEITNALPSGVSLLEFNLQAVRRNEPPPMPNARTIFEQKQAEIAREQAIAAEQRRQTLDPSLRPRLYDVTMKLTGVADTDVQVAQLITRLNKTPLFKDVNLLISDQFDRDGRTLRKFQIELSLVPDADVSHVKLATQTAAVPLGGESGGEEEK
jgi:Tfp pilus assembly protein PilN